VHDHDAQGNEFFKCDFCHRAWSEDLPMVEGHQGSLICAECLSAAYLSIVLGDADERPGEGGTCTLCLESRDELHHRGQAGGYVCRRCVRQSATAMERDPDSEWRKPAAG
jgi:formylmethanofuran dehydrogenase subunit E